MTEYLRDAVRKAIVNQRIDASEMSEFYLVNLLKDFQNIDSLFVRDGDHYDEEALALIFAKALASNLPSKIKALKRLGDYALYISGFFADHVERKLVDIDYYISMGGGAYLSLSGILSGSKTFYELYEELSKKFPSFVEVFREVSISNKIHTNLDILRLYERWLKTHDDRIRSVLEDEGIIPGGDHLTKVA